MKSIARGESGHQIGRNFREPFSDGEDRWPAGTQSTLVFASPN